MKTAVILNTSAGIDSNDPKLPDRIRTGFRTVDRPIDLVPVPGDQLLETAKQLAGLPYDSLVIAGGDGSVNTVAGVLAGTRTPMGVLPRGTLNHFAKDAGIPLDLQAAVGLVAGRKPRPIDLGEVNGIVFINNSSVGLYPGTVELRNHYLQRTGAKKWLATAVAMLGMLARFPLLTVQLQAGGNTVQRTTPLVVIGNNEYTFDLFNGANRTTFVGGKLSLYTANCRRRSGVLKFVLPALFNRIDLSREFAMDFVEELRLETRRSPIRVAVDGEVLRLIPPLCYRIRRCALLVHLPPGKT